VDIVVAASLPLYAAPTLYRLRGKRREMAVIQQLKLAAFVLLTGLAIVLLLAVMGDYASGSEGGDVECRALRFLNRETLCLGRSASRQERDYTVTRSTTIDSQRPIWLLVVQAGLGVLNASEHMGVRLSGVGTGKGIAGETIETTLRIDGQPAPGIRGVARAAWRLAGFVVWDEAGRIERVTTISVHGHVVHIYDRVSNGSVRVRVVVGPPLGDPLVRCAVLELEADDVETGIRDGWAGRLVGTAGSTIRLRCSAIIDLPGDRRRDRVHTRRERWGCDRPTLSERIADREAGPELSSRVIGLATAGRAAVLDGRGRLTDSVVAEFLERTCR
jgi:hypothetical protein